MYATAYSLFGTQEKVAELFGVPEREVRRQMEAARLVGILEEAKKPAHAPVSLPRDATKVDYIARTAKDLYEDRPKKQVELYESLKDKSRDDVKRAVTHMRAKAEMEPKKFESTPVKEIVKEVFKTISVDVSVTFDSSHPRQEIWAPSELNFQQVSQIG